MEIAIKAVRSFIESYSRGQSKTKSLADDGDLFKCYGWEGDDTGDFMEAFGDKFKVNMENYLWYFHHEDEPPRRSLNSFIIKRPWMRVERIPITISDLAKAIVNKEWSLSYPDHDIAIPLKEKVLGILVYVGLPLTFFAWLYSRL